jgi:hypothetical protein
MEQSHPISNFICKDCYGLLLSWYQFRETVKATNSFILKSLAKVKKQTNKSQKMLTMDPQVVEYEEKPVIKIQKMPPIDVKQPLYVAPQIKIQKMEVLDEPTEQKDYKILSLEIEKDFDLPDILVNVETIESDCDETHKSNEKDDFHWPETATTQAVSKKEANWDPKTYYCCQCSKNFAKQFELREHMHVDHARDIEKIKQKMKTVLDDHSFPCENCTSRFTTYRTLKNHQDYYRQAAKLCTICGEVVPNYKTAFAQHLRKHQTTVKTDKHERIENEASCCMCSSIFEQRSDLFAHAENEHSLQITKCMVKSSFSNDSWECDLCTLKFATQTLLRRHQSRFKEVEMCPDCGILVPLFRRSSHATMHRARVAKQYQCDICKKIFRDIFKIR